MWGWLRRDERGQSIVEVAGVSVFLLLLGVMIFEVGVTFSSYIALLNASREGALYASEHIELCDAGKTPTDSTEYINYEAVALGEVRLGHMVDASKLTLHRPELVNGTSSIGDPIKVQIDYRLQTFTSSIELPLMGRFGLPYYWPLSAWTIMPIR